MAVSQSCNTTGNYNYDDIEVNFQSTELGFDEDEESKQVTVSVTAAIDTDATIEVLLETTTLTYGTDFTTTPAANNNIITLTLEAGQTSTSFSVNKIADLYDGDESIVFSFRSANQDLAIGSNTLTLSFSAIVSEGASITLNGGEGGTSAVNSVFVDFSSNEQAAVDRTSWVLGFYCGDSYAIKMNNTNTTNTAMLADGLSVSDVISAADSTTYLTTLNGTSLDLVDDIDGDLTKCVIKTGAVYLVKIATPAENESKLYKVLVNETSTGYLLQYAQSGSATVTSVEITKESKYNFIYYSFGQADVVSVEPAKVKWDIRWSRQVYRTTNSSTGEVLAYGYSDFVAINYLGGAQAAQVMTESFSYNSFALSNVEGIDLSSDVNIIGGNWRATTGTTKGVYTDRFYVVKDPVGNYYKLRFLKAGIGSDGGTRGYPELEYALLQ